MNWIIPANMKTYDVLSAFNENTHVDWRQNAKFEIGDNVYVYVSRPYKRVIFKTVVTKIQLAFNETIEDKKYWTNPSEYESSKAGKYMRLELIREVDSQLLTLEKLLENGMKAAPQGATKLREETWKYIEQCMSPEIPIKLEMLSSEFNRQLLESKILSDEVRLKKIAVAKKMPQKVKVISSVFKRNADVVIAILERANGVCERCGADAPFKRVSDGTPYLEVHHKVRLADGGEDTVENAIAVCPNCHRELHYGV